MRPHLHASLVLLTCSIPLVGGCSSDAPEGLAPAQPADVTVKMDFDHRPLPDIATPTDLATRYDATSPTGLRLNPSRVAPTWMERVAREQFNTLDGWGTFAGLSIPFTGDIDVQSIIQRHREDNYDQSNDAIYVLNITPSSPEYGQAEFVDIGEGNFPVVLKEIDGYWKHDPRGHTNSILFEETDEDLNGDGILQPEEDTDCDAVLDRPNYLPGAKPTIDDLGARADALMSFYDRETHTLSVRPLVPLLPRTTYAVVVTRRLLDIDGNPVGSPYQYINHVAQTEKLGPLPSVLARHGLSLSDVAFTWAYTTGSGHIPMVAVRDGLYGHGVQSHLASDYPPDVKQLETLRDDGADPYFVEGSTLIEALAPIAEQLLNKDVNSVEYRELVESHHYIDYHALGTYVSPQLFMRTGPNGETLNLNEQAWPPDLDVVPAVTRPENVTFWLTVPRKEVSVRGQGKPAPVVIIGHGYGSQKFELLEFAGFLARHGLACIAIDDVSHGLGITKIERNLATALLSEHHLGPFAEAQFKDRAFDQNNDGVKDSAADFWTSYVFHTRDVVRQSALDYMQLIRILRSFDGERVWKGGRSGVAGDFDGDGNIDVGADAEIHMVGGSLGGMMSTVVGGVEPEMSSIVPVSGGGGGFDIAMRSRQGGVREAVILRVMGPVYLGVPREGAPGTVDVETLIPDLNTAAQIPVGEFSDVRPGDTVVATNLSNGVRRCTLVNPDGSFRVSVESDLADLHQLDVYDGAVLTAQAECEFQAGAESKLKSSLRQFGVDVSFQYDEYEEGEPLRALAEGLGLRRANPELRRFTEFARSVFDAADPAVFATFLHRRTLTHPGTGQTVNTRAFVVNTSGDMNVPVNAGAAIARSAGFIDFQRRDPRYGITPNQVLLDHHVIEAVNVLKRYEDSTGKGILFDVENLSEGTDQFPDAPRLEKPLRLVQPTRGGLGGVLFPYITDEGEHGFPFPGGGTDRQIRLCQSACTLPGEDDPCECASAAYFDIGRYMFNLMGTYFASGGTKVNFDLCHSRGDCPDGPPTLDP